MAGILQSMIRHLHEYWGSNFWREFYKVSFVIFTNFLDQIFWLEFDIRPLSALTWRSKAHKQNNPFSIRRWKDCPSRSPSFNTLNEEHGTYGGGWGEIDESNLSIQLQHCNYTVVVHNGMFSLEFVQWDSYLKSLII